MIKKKSETEVSLENHPPSSPRDTNLQEIARSIKIMSEKRKDISCSGKEKFFAITEMAFILFQIFSPFF